MEISVYSTEKLIQFIVNTKNVNNKLFIYHLILPCQLFGWKYWNTSEMFMIHLKHLFLYDLFVVVFHCIHLSCLNQVKLTSQNLFFQSIRNKRKNHIERILKNRIQTDRKKKLTTFREEMDGSAKKPDT